jgi:uncharacterized protein YcfJ
MASTFTSAICNPSRDESRLCGRTVVGARVGDGVGEAVGLGVGGPVGCALGDGVGAHEGADVGSGDGLLEGCCREGHISHLSLKQR